MCKVRFLRLPRSNISSAVAVVIEGAIDHVYIKVVRKWFILISLPAAVAVSIASAQGSVLVVVASSHSCD